MLNDSSNNHLIRWSVDGHAICIPDVAAFSKEILPQYFKHNNWSSFIRQLNLYEFRRVNVSEPTGGSDPRQTYFFMNDDFQRGQSDRLSRIKRQSTTHKTASSSSTTTTGETTSSQGGRRRGSNEPEHDHHHYCFLNEEGTCAAESKMTQLHDLVVETEKKCNYLSKEAENLRMIYNKQQEV
ncbi:HSF-type DNA-binding-domain-containing protein [Phascolomyces articulosus]|uniref:HSF-type DNA-binding-domain-containing protein n=1 Tax=Phascolomyces articulosus TaxID=60185 RepID=A0AAD5P8F8_9FUNG|nr:HSF-type DNA-binding-domain-containing protein [Phascolomyces articulosus]